MEGWTDFAVITGASAAALLGLLFVAVSIKVDIIGRSIALQAQATQTMTLFVVALLISFIFGIPRLPLWVFGVLVVVLGVLSGGLIALLERRAVRAGDGNHLSEILSSTTPGALVSLSILGSGVCALVGFRWSGYLLVPATVLAVVGGVINAWLFLVRLGD